MKLESKYNFNDKVWVIRYQRETRFITCEFCGGTGQIKGENNKDRSCPECYSRGGSYQRFDLQWELDTDETPITIGEIRIEANCDFEGYESDIPWSNYGPQIKRQSIVYMCFETGIGSGSLWRESLLWPTKEEAQAECDRRNEAGEVPE